MGRAEVSLPAELLRRATDAELDLSVLVHDVIVAELDRLAKIAAMERDLAQLEAEIGPAHPTDRARAEAWLDEVLGPPGDRR